MRRIFRIIGFLFALLLIVVLGYPAARLVGLYLGGHVVKTARGPMEIATRGEGPAVLIVHGVMGGYPQGLLLSDNLVRGGFEAISVSRPGYMRTPLSTGTTPQEQGEALAALLDALQIKRAVVVGISAGGMSSISLSLSHPDRVAGLVLFSGVSTLSVIRQQPHTMRINDAMPEFHPFLWDVYALGGSLAARVYPRTTLSRTLGAMNVRDPAARKETLDAVMASPDQRARLDGAIDSIFPVEEKIDGLRNDVQQVSSLQEAPLDRITVPTLIIHGTDDRLLPFTGAVEAQKQIPHSQLVAVPGAGHVLILGPHAAEVDAALLQFCRRVEGP